MEVMPLSDELREGDERFRIVMEIKHAGGNGLTDGASTYATSA